MLKILIKNQISRIFQTYYIDRKTGKARTIKESMRQLLFFVMLYIALGISFYGMADGLGRAILNNGINWLYFSIMGLIAMALGVFASVFSTYSTLYFSKDNELMLSLPISTRTLILSRLIGVYAVSFIYCAWIWIPTIIAYNLIVSFTISGIIFPVLMTFILSLFVTILSSILGFVVALIASRTNGNNIIRVVLSLVILVAYYVIYYRLSNALSRISEYMDSVSIWFKSWLYYIYLLGSASDGNIISLALSVLITVVIASIIFFIIYKTFNRLLVMKGRKRKKVNNEFDYKSRKINSALLVREYKNFTAYPTWMLNGGFGLFIMPVLAIIMIVKCNSIDINMLQLMFGDILCFPAILSVLILLGTCFIVSTNCILPVSISIEGKTLWQLKCLPIDAWQVIRSKEKMFVQMNMIASLPLILVSCIIFNIDIVMIILIYLGVYVFTYMMADFGLYLNLKYPNFSWTNVATLAKQSYPVMVSLFGGWIFIILLGYIMLSFSNYLSSLMMISSYIGLCLIICLAFRIWLKNRGTKIFNKL